MHQVEISPNQIANRQQHYDLCNEEENLKHAPEDLIYDFAENQVIHYLSEHILGINHPWLNKDSKGSYSYKLTEETALDGRKFLMPSGYDGKTTFIDVCSKPYSILANRISQPDYQPTVEQEEQNLRVFKRAEAEMIGAKKFEELIVNASDNSLVVWSSPPGNPEDGYWDSSITFVAHVKATEDTSQKREIRCFRCINDLELEQHVLFLNSLDLSQQKKLSFMATAEEIVSQPIRVSAEYSDRDVSRLINYLYSQGSNQPSFSEATTDVEKLQEIREKVSPLIENLSTNLKEGDTEMASLELDEIERQAMGIYFSPHELHEIAYGKSVAIYSPSTLNNYDNVLAAASLARRQEIAQKGSSCPSVSGESIDSITGQSKSLDPHQQLIDNLENFNSSENIKCLNCNQPLRKNDTQCPSCKTITCMGIDKKRKGHLAA